MSDIQCPIQIPSVDGEFVQCINYPMGDAILCAEDARTLGVIRWAVLNDPDIREALYLSVGEITIEVNETPTGVILGPDTPGEIAEKTAEALVKGSKDEPAPKDKKSAGKKGA